MRRTMIAIAVGALSAGMASGALAQDNNEEQRFIEADANGDGYLSQQEAEDGLDMDQERFDQADTNDDDRLTLQEYLSAVNQEQGGQQQSSQQQAGQDEGTTVTVDEQAADIEVEQEPPTVTIEQHSPDVTITQPEPEVHVEQAEPDVEIQEAEPNVTVEEQGEAEVQVESGGEVDVEMQHEEEQQQDQQQQTQTTTEQESSLMSMQASELEGMMVVTNQDEEMGEIDRIARHTQDGQLYGIVSTGGFLGFGAEELAIPLEALEVQGGQLVSQQERSEEQLRSAAEEYREEDFEEVEGDQRLSEARGGSS
ncbi:PRC-barrel domain-containing protein [Vreelandella rituensis]|uniref:PRC-barrel domain-containing protein n=1 Tax=Vreelandella rituensis TaxID=2282306 RepID=A0A368U906_9GAMM|nr:PRC-barrel domain-containing protein [Halomonas rituensis]RCV92907.1 hypothetical protein DU506_04990 [Halomonas rituensis]